MSRGVYALLAAQFLTAFADNALLFVAIAMVLGDAGRGDWYVPALQSSFLVAFVVLAPWVGRLADRLSKPWVLVIGNLAKAFGTMLIVAGIEPLAAYAVVGVGAAIYGPAKYGILPELVGHRELVRANSWIEGSTILAIVLGTVVGGRLADHSTGAALALVLVAFVASVAVTFLVPRPPPRGVERGSALAQFGVKLSGFFVTARARFAMLGASLFWAAAAVLRVVLVAWAPAVLLLASAGDIAELTLVLAVGIILGAAGAPRLVPIERLRRARLAAYATGALILVLATADSVWAARGVLLGIGVAGGLFVVPLNAALQEIGHRSIGAGGAVAIQSFFENLAMLLGVGLYTYASARGVDPVAALLALGLAVVVATVFVAWRLPPDAATATEGGAVLAAPPEEGR